MTEPDRDAPDDRPSRYARPVPPPMPDPSDAPDDTEIPAMPAAFATPPARARVALATVARLAGPPAALSVLATISLLVALVTLREMRSLAVNAWLLAIGGLLVWTCWRTLAAALPTSAASPFDSVSGHPPEPPSELRDVRAIVGVILDAEWSWRLAEFRLRPLLRNIAAARLIERYQVNMEAEPAAARRILGDELWALVGPDAYGPAEGPGAGSEDPARAAIHRPRRHLPGGIPRATIRRAVDLLEAL